VWKDWNVLSIICKLYIERIRRTQQRKSENISRWIVVPWFVSLSLSLSFIFYNVLALCSRLLLTLLVRQYPRKEKCSQLACHDCERARLPRDSHDGLTWADFQKAPLSRHLVSPSSLPPLSSLSLSLSFSLSLSLSLSLVSPSFAFLDRRYDGDRIGRSVAWMPNARTFHLPTHPFRMEGGEENTRL